MILSKNFSLRYIYSIHLSKLSRVHLLIKIEEFFYLISSIRKFVQIFKKNNHQKNNQFRDYCLSNTSPLPTKTIPDKTQPSTIINLQSSQLYDDHAWFTDIWHGGSVHDRCTRYIRKRDEDACIEDAFYYTCIQLYIYIYSWALTCTRHVDQKGAVYRTSHDSTGFSVSLVTPRERRACHVSSPISVILPHRRQLRRLVQRKSDGQWSMDEGERALDWCAQHETNFFFWKFEIT